MNNMNFSASRLIDRRMPTVREWKNEEREQAKAIMLVVRRPIYCSFEPLAGLKQALLLIAFFLCCSIIIFRSEELVNIHLLNYIKVIMD